MPSYTTIFSSSVIPRSVISKRWHQLAYSKFSLMYTSQILDLKGTPRPEQNNLLDKFLTITSTKSDLASTSLLSNLDMDPGSTSQVASSEIAATSVSLSVEGSKGERKEVFSNLRNLVSFAVRRDRETSK
jgi:hypothetical protein